MPESLPPSSPPPSSAPSGRYQFACRVVSRYLPEQSSSEQSLFAFAYTVRLTNTGQVAAQLIARHWVIVDANGLRQEVKGLGAVGQQPLLAPGEAFEYTSGTRLRTSTGTMHGSFFCVAEDGERFEVPVDLFVLQDGAASDNSARVLH
jgi:ApaG protein